jgi:hypothetical protein
MMSVQEDYDEAIAYIREENYGEACKWLRKVSKQVPDLAEVLEDLDEPFHQLQKIANSDCVKTVRMDFYVTAGNPGENLAYDFDFSSEEIGVAEALVSIIGYLRYTSGRPTVLYNLYAIPISRSTRFSDKTIYKDQSLKLKLQLNEIKLGNAKKNPDAPQALNDEITEDINAIKAELKFRKEETTRENDDDIPF